MSFFKSIGKALNVVKDIGLPILGTALGGPLGGIAAGALAKSVGHGKPTVGNALGGAATGALAGLGGSLLGGASSAAGETAGLSGLGGGLLKSAGGALVKNAPLIIGGVSALQNAKQGAHAQDLQTEALDLARARDAELSPLRTAGIAAALDRFQHPVTPFDAVGGYMDAGNPYSVQPRGAPTQGALPATPGRGVTPLLLARGARQRFT